MRGARTARLVYKALYCTVRVGATYGRRKFGDKILFCLFFKIVLADAEGANKVIIIAPISESDTLLFAVSH